MSQYFSCHLSLEFINVMLYLLMRQLESYNTQLQAKLSFLKYQILSKEIAIQKRPFLSRKHLILKMINQSKQKIRLWIKLHNKDKKSYKLNNWLMQSQESLYQLNPNFSRLKYPILSSQVHKALHFMISQKVFLMLEMRQVKVMNKLLKAKKERLLQEIKQMVMLNQRICSNLTATQPNLLRIHAI